MANKTALLQRICTELKQIMQTGSGRPELWRPLQDQIADHVLSALLDDTHPLSQDLADLRELAVGPEPSGNTKTFDQKYEQKRRFFTPTPGSIDKVQNRFWPLQLLLYTVANSSKRLRLVEVLQMSVLSIEQVVKQASTASVALWSPGQHAGYLIEAITHLNAPEPELALSADNRTLTYGRVIAKLSQQNGQFMRLLLEHTPEPIPMPKLTQAGICHAIQTKRRLVKCAAQHGIALNIAFVAGSFALLSWSLLPDTENG
ncbi:MAG: hypothetical protein WCI73_04940 [Phycisphaerae bacterium]